MLGVIFKTASPQEMTMNCTIVSDFLTDQFARAVAACVFEWLQVVWGVRKITCILDHSEIGEGGVRIVIPYHEDYFEEPLVKARGDSIFRLFAAGLCESAFERMRCMHILVELQRVEVIFIFSDGSRSPLAFVATHEEELVEVPMGGYAVPEAMIA